MDQSGALESPHLVHEVEVLTSRIDGGGVGGGASKARHPGWVGEGERVRKLKRRGSRRDLVLEQNQQLGWATGRRSQSTHCLESQSKDGGCR